MNFSLILKIFLIIIIAYIAIVIFVYSIQRSLLYIPDIDSYEDEELTINYKKVNITNSQGNSLRSIFYENEKTTKTTLVMFHGNAGPIENRFYKINKLSHFEQNILLISWRGYSGNDGQPSEIGLYDDANSAISWIEKRGIKKKDIILYGESLGTGVVTELASKNIYKAIILEAPFTSMIDAASFHYPYLPASLMLKDRYESDKKINKIKSPVFVMHSIKDDIVPFWMGRKIFQLANEPKMSFFVEDNNHLVTYSSDLMLQLKKFYKDVNEKIQ